MPMGNRPKPPTEQRPDLIQKLTRLLERRWPGNPREQKMFLIDNFTTLDLVGLVAQLEKADG